MLPQAQVGSAWFTMHVNKWWLHNFNTKCSNLVWSNHWTYLVAGSWGMNDAASGVAQFAYKCILEHFFSTCWNIVRNESQVGHIGQWWQEGAIYSKVDYPQGPCMHRFWRPVYFVTETLRASCRRYLMQNVLFRVFFLLDPLILHSCICILTLVSFCS